MHVTSQFPELLKWTMSDESRNRVEPEQRRGRLLCKVLSMHAPPQSPAFGLRIMRSLRYFKLCNGLELEPFYYMIILVIIRAREDRIGTKFHHLCLVTSNMFGLMSDYTCILHAYVFHLGWSRSREDFLHRIHLALPTMGSRNYRNHIYTRLLCKGTPCTI
jgi:hypothetical protein